MRKPALVPAFTKVTSKRCFSRLRCCAVFAVAVRSIVAFIVCEMLGACESEKVIEEPAAITQAKDATTPETGSRTILLPHDEPEFPSGPGKETFVKCCIVCHSLRYISMQPDFTEKIWTKEVEKMRLTWGAHINDAEAKEIIAYLVLVKGKKP